MQNPLDNSGNAGKLAIKQTEKVEHTIPKSSQFFIHVHVKKDTDYPLVDNNNKQQIRSKFTRNPLNPLQLTNKKLIPGKGLTHLYKYITYMYISISFCVLKQ